MKQTSATSPAPVQIQRGSNAGAAIFCFPGAGASVTCFLPLAESSGQQFDFFGMQPRGLDDLDDPCASVEEAAAESCRAICTVARGGPLVLIGHSFGGWIAFEAAIQLRRVGVQVSRIVLMDTEPPSGAKRRRGAQDRADALGRVLRVLRIPCGADRLGTYEHLRALSKVEQDRFVCTQMKACGLLPRVADVDVTRRMLAVFLANMATDYVPGEQVSADVLLVHPETLIGQDQRAGCASPFDDYAMSSDEALGSWQKFATRVDRLIVPGNHLTMLQRANVAAVARRCREWTTP